MEYLHVTEELKSEVRKYFSISEEIIKTDVNILKEWYKKQPHFPEIQNTHIYFEHALLWNKFRMEKTKQKIECIFTVRELLGDEFMFGVCNVIPIKEPTIVFPLPFVNPVNKERIMLWTINYSDQSKYSYEKDIQQWFLCFHYLLRFDYSHGIRFVVDLQNTSGHHLGKTNPVLLLKFINAYTNNINHRFNGCHYINASSFHSKLITLTKAILPDKLSKRVYIHKDNTSLYENVPPQCLPKELGGQLEPKQILKEKWNSEILQYKEEFTEFLIKRIDESVRPPDSPSFNNLCNGFGVEGTFKKLNID